MSATAHDHKLVHQAFEYSSREGFVAAMAPFMRDGLERGDRLFAATSGANIAALREELGDVAAAIDFRDADEWYRQPYRTLYAYSRYVDEHADGSGRVVRVIGEPVWHGRSPAATREWARYESALNVAFASSPAWIVCPYDTTALPEEILAHARLTHPEVLAGGHARPSGDFLPPQHFFAALFAAEEAGPPVGAARLELAEDDFTSVRSFVAAEAARAGLGPERVDDLVLAVNELVTNGARHGSHPVSVSIWRDDNELVCEVEDAGLGLPDPLIGCSPPPPTSVSGRGLWIVRQICDSLDVLPSPMGGVALRARLAL